MPFIKLINRYINSENIDFIERENTVHISYKVSYAGGNEISLDQEELELLLSSLTVIEPDSSMESHVLEN